MSLPSPKDSIQAVAQSRNVVMAAVVGGGVCLFAAIVGLILIGLKQAAGQDSITALSTIGGSLAGGFAGWIARDVVERRQGD